MIYPTLNSGYASPVSTYWTYAAYPNFWRGCVGAWCPSLGVTGSVLHDFSGFGHRGTLTNMDPGTDWVPSEGKYALDLDYTTGGSRQAVDLPSNFTFSGLATASVEVWVKPLANPGSNAAFFYESTGTSGFTRFAIFHLSGGALLLAARDTDTGSAYSVTSASTSWTGQWHHLVGTYSANNDRMELFADGVSLGANTASKNALYSGPAASLPTIGAFNAGALSSSVDAYIAAASAYNRVFSAGEVQLRYQLGRAGAYQLKPRRYYSVQAAASGGPFPHFIRRNQALSGGLMAC